MNKKVIDSFNKIIGTTITIISNPREKIVGGYLHRVFGDHLKR